MPALHARRARRRERPVREISLYFLDVYFLLFDPFLTGNRIHYPRTEAVYMNDLLYLGLTILFFALTYGLIVVCERLMEDKP
jgi:hypothetical protein